MSVTAIGKLSVQEFMEMDTLEEGFLYELINGELVKRSSPSADHQRSSRQVFKILENFVSTQKLGECFYAPFDVIFDEENLTQPDILFVSQAKSAIVTENCVEGAPDLIIEILSPGTFKTDRGDKMKLYSRFGVQEYWIVDPKNRAVEVYGLSGQVYELISFGIESGVVESTVLPGLKIPVEQIF